MSSLQSLRELISERLAAAAEEICRLCEGTIVQYEQELCRQRRLLDICWKPQLQLHHIVLPQHYATEEEDLSNQQMNSRVEQEEPEPSLIEMEQRESEPLQIKEEQEGLCISQIEEQLDLKQETDTLIEIFTYKGNEYSEADLNNQQTFNIHSEEGNQHEESTSTAYGETEPQSQWSFKKETLFEKSKQLPKEKRLSFAKSRIAPSVSVYMRTESDKIPCICEECGKSFDCWSKFRLHMRSHTGEKPFSCKVCAKSFSHMSNLKTHMRTHTGEKPFSCKICDKSFSQVSTLRTHMRIHTGEKPFSCKLCDASFSNITHLKTHIRTHTGEKPFSCKECHRSFSQNSSLKIHMRTHTGEKPFFCKECDKCFSQKSNLKAHMRTHPGKKLFPSEEFDTSFSQTPNLEDTRSRTS